MLTGLFWGWTNGILDSFDEGGLGLEAF